MRETPDVLAKIKFEAAEAARWAAWHEWKYPKQIDKIRAYEDEAASLMVVYRRLSEELPLSVSPEAIDA